MKTLNDFKNENKDLENFEMSAKIGGLVADPTKELTCSADSNWNCGDVRICNIVDLPFGGSITVCETKALP